MSAVEKSLRGRIDKVDSCTIEVIRDLSLNKWLGERPSFLSLPREELKYDYLSRLGRSVPKMVDVGVRRVREDEHVHHHVKAKGFWNRYSLNSKLMTSRAGLYLIYEERDEPLFSMFRQAGRGEVTVPDGSYACGSLRHHGGRVVVCTNVEGHKGKVVDGRDATGKYVVFNETISCSRIQCPVCFLSYAVKVAKSVSARVETASERFGCVVDVGTVSPDVELVSGFMEKFGSRWEEELRGYIWSFLKGMGVLGCVTVRHARRIDRVRQDLHGSLHYHFLALVPSFGKCRDCVSRDLHTGISPFCRECDGFMSCVLKARDAGSGLILKVFSKRKSFEGTMCYLMSHASQRVDVERDHVIRYYGCLAFCKLKTKPFDRRVTCVACGEFMRRDRKYVGSKVLASRSIWQSSYKSFVVVDVVDSVTGLPNFVDRDTVVDDGG